MDGYTHPKGKGFGKYNGMAKAGDWENKRIRACRKINNCVGQGVNPGMRGTVSGVYAGLSVTFDVCGHCGTVMYVAKLAYSSVELCG